MAYRKFDVVTAKDGKKQDATIFLTQKDYNPAAGHKAEASVSSRTLTVIATIGEKLYKREIADIDIQEAVKVETKSKQIEVSVKKTSDFKMTDKL